MTDHILVTGATGNVGKEVVSILQATGAPVRTAVRKPPKDNLPAGTEAVAFDFRDESTYATAFEGAKAMFLIRPPDVANPKRDLFPALEAARAAGVERVAFLSLLGAEKNHFVPHRAIEDWLRASGLSWTFLRAGFFMQNLSGVHRADIAERSEIMVPAGHGRTAFIHARDIAAVAVKALTEGGYSGRALNLTGDKALDYFEVAGLFTQVLGRPVVYRAPSIFRFVRHMRGAGHPLPFILVMAAIYTTTRFGMASRITHDVEAALGRPPIQLRAFIEEYRALWEL